MEVSSPLPKGFMEIAIEFFSLARPRPEESDTQKFIRAFAEGGKLPKAKELFQKELLNMYQACDNLGELGPNVREMVAFGNKVLGEEQVLRILNDCIRTVSAQISQDIGNAEKYGIVC